MALYSQLFLRNTTSPYGDFTRNSVLSFKDLDQNFIFLKERDISNISYSSDTLTIETLGGNSFSTTIVNSDTFVTGGTYNPSTVSLDFTGNSGFTPFNMDVSSLTDTYVSGGVFDPNTGCVTFSTTSGYTFDVCGFVTGSTLGSGTLNRVSKWTPDGSTLGDSIIQDDGVTVGVNISPTWGSTMTILTHSGSSTNGLCVYQPNSYGVNSNSTGIYALTTSQNSSETLVTGIHSQVSPSTYNSDTGYFGVKGVVGGTLSNPDSDFDLKVGVLGNYEYATLSGYGVMGQVGGLNQADGVGVKGRFRDNSGDRVTNFIGVVGEASYGKTGTNFGVTNSAIGVYGTVDIYTTSEATTANIGGKFDAKYSVNGAITNLHALYVDGVSTVSGGTITNGYGVYIDSNTETFGTITNKYGIYQVGFNDENYFGGKVIVNNDLDVTGQISVGSVTGGTVTTGNTFDYDCDLGMTQKLDLQGATTGATITFSNQKEGSTYTLVVVQGSGTYDLTFPSGWWLNDTAPFDFTTLADNDRVMVTSTYLDGEWYFAVKGLTLV